MVKGIYNIVSELKLIRLRLLSLELVKGIRIIIKDEARKYDRNVEQSTERL
jgi:hypothetical protein